MALAAGLIILHSVIQQHEITADHLVQQVEISGFISLEDSEADYEAFWDFIYNEYPFTEVCERKGADLKKIKEDGYKEIKSSSPRYSQNSYISFYAKLCEDITSRYFTGHLYPASTSDYEYAMTVSDSYFKLYDMTMDAELTRADLDGAVVVASMGNDNQEDTGSFASANLTVGVAATDIHGNRADYSNYGKGTTVAFYGGPVSTRNYANGKIYHETKGTSVATPLVAGFLALAMEKWPEATNRQILQSLIRTAARDDGVEWDPGYGYGLANLRGLLTEDPTSLPDENPLLHKNNEWVPSEEYYNDYIDLLRSKSVV